MLLHPTLQSLRGMKLNGMAQALQEQLELGHGKELEFEERFALLVDREVIHRQNKGFDRRLRNAKLKHNASLEDIDYKYPRKLEGSLVRSLASCDWVREHHNLIITGARGPPGAIFRARRPTGVGKTFVASALANQACRIGFTETGLKVC